MAGEKCRECKRPVDERLVDGLCRSCLLKDHLCTSCGEPVDLFTLCGYIEPSSICIDCRDAESGIVSGAS
jgi:hypothetical protein